MDYDLIQKIQQHPGVELYRCPNDGRILTGFDHDDKVLCGCGRQQPAARGGPDSRSFTEPTGTHIRRFLPKATALDLMAAAIDREEDHHGGE